MWHRKGFKIYWSWECRNSGGRPRGYVFDPEVSPNLGCSKCDHTWRDIERKLLKRLPLRNFQKPQ
jgi:hypothetical protein